MDGRHIDCTFVSGKDDSVSEKMCWLPVDRLDDFDIRPTMLKDLVRFPPKDFKLYINR